MTKTIRIALSTDAQGYGYNATLIASILRRTAWNVHIRCWCRGFLPESFEQGKLRLEFIPAGEEVHGKVPAYVGLAVFDRLQVIQQCNDWDRCLILDYDQLVLCDLAPLYEMEIGDHLLAAKHHGNGVDLAYAMQHWATRVIPPEWQHAATNAYFSMGVLLNLKSMRLAGTWSDLERIQQSFGLDENLALVAACQGRTLPFDKRWNLFPKQDIREGEMPQGIIHWLGWPKPWHKNAKVWRPDVWLAERCSWEHLRMGIWEKPLVWELEPEDDHGVKGLLDRGWRVQVTAARFREGRVKHGGYPDLILIAPEEAVGWQSGEIPQWIRFGPWCDAAAWLRERREICDDAPEYVSLRGPQTQADLEAVRTLGYGRAFRFRSHEWPAGGPMPRVLHYTAQAWNGALEAGEELVGKWAEVLVPDAPMAAGCAAGDSAHHAPKPTAVPAAGEMSALRQRVCVSVFVAQGEEGLVDLTIQALRRNFLIEHELRFLVFTESAAMTQSLATLKHATVIYADGANRYAAMQRHRAEWAGADYVYMMQANLSVRARVGGEVLSDTVAVLHAGYYQKSRPSYSYEKNPRSAAHVAAHEGRNYYSGSIQGGSVASYGHAIEAISEQFSRDDANGIAARWAEEAHWNRYLIDHPPSTTLSPAYAWTQSAAKDHAGVIVQLPQSAFALTV